MTQTTDKKLIIKTANQAYAASRDLAHGHNPQTKAFYLNEKYEVIHTETVAVGTVTVASVEPRSVYRPALVVGAVAIVIASNHPSGSLEPTSAELEVAAQLFRGGQLLGIELLDFLILTDETYLSIIGEQYK
jgi:DNA repair protein RadC